MSQTTRIDVSISGNSFAARCPHIPGGKEYTSDREHRAVNQCMDAVREYVRGFGDQPVPWIKVPAKADAKNVHSRSITGLWPRGETTTPSSADMPAKPAKA